MTCLGTRRGLTWYMTPFHHHVARLCKKHATPRVLSPRGMLEPWALGHKRMKKKLAWWLYQEKDLQTASALHATAAAEALQFRGLGFEMPLFVRPNGIEVPESFSRKKLSSKPSLEGGARTALFLSRIHLKKGLDMWVEAWSAVRPEGWNMRVVGPDAGGHRRAIEAQVKAAGLADSWSFSGPLEGDDKWRAMRAADLFILPTRSENFGIVVAEALGVGVPVITTTAAPWEGLEHHACGWWVAPEADALAIALGQATELSTDALGNMGERGRAWVEEAFSWPVIAAAMLASYQKVLMEHR